MPKWTTRFLPISLSLLLLVSCGGIAVEGLKPVPLQKQNFRATYFSDSAADYVYKSSIEAYGNHLSGIIVIKKIDSTHHRVVLTTEFGNKLIDLEIGENDYQLNNIVEELNRKMLIKLLVEDFRLLLREGFLVSDQFEKDGKTVLLTKQNNTFDYLFLDTKLNLAEIRRASKRKEKFSIRYTSENNIFADSIQIKHQNIPLQINLQFFKNQ